MYQPKEALAKFGLHRTPTLPNPIRQVASQGHDLLFKAIHGNTLIYNACWEDPRIDRELLQLTADSRVVMLTSAGCNALDYLLDGPAEIHTVDVNPRQNALLQLKLALLRQETHEDLFAMFGYGVHAEIDQLYRRVRPLLPDFATRFWDNHTHYFQPTGNRKTFYYRGASGWAAWLFSRHLLRIKSSLRAGLLDLLECETLRSQRQVFAKIEADLWNQLTCWVVQQPLLMSMLGVPQSQMALMRAQEGSIQSYIDRCLRHVLTEIPMRDNYFWRVYLTGSYSRDCCPNYMKAQYFPTLRERAERVYTHTATLSDFLYLHPGKYTHFILLDHQDWLATHAPDALLREWKLIIANSAPGAKVLLRSASGTLDFLPAQVRTHLRFYPERTLPLHALDRVGTYASLHLAEVIGGNDD
ncbi:MAG: BtaA family protein [Caldilineaceae bacterium]|nr:BtaA family protein [Caldilineaceae bacterium]MCB0182932.1 BtaA family protein [Caldilineaceae bacterium]